MRYFGFILLLWSAGELHAQSDSLPCPAPSLDRGYFVPEHETYSHGAKLQYACNTRLKPAVEGWWATSTCQNGIWSHIPQCIDENACIPPTITNGRFTVTQVGWYDNRAIIEITCDKGYEHKDNDVTAQCKDGTWSTLPVCDKSRDACSEPPKIPHAVIINQKYEELFPANSQVQYECEKGFTIEGSPIICKAGTWTEQPNCSRKPGTGQGGSVEVGTQGGDTTSAGGGTQPGDGGSRPGSGGGGGAGGDSTSAGTGTQQGGGGAGGDSTSAGTGTQQGGGGSSTKPVTTRTAINSCGSNPVIPNADVVTVDPMYLKYKCNAFYTLVGDNTVVCYSDGSWSQLPTCKEAFCQIKPGRYDAGLIVQIAEFIKEGETKYLPCIWRDYGMNVQCLNGGIFHSRCCYRYDHYRGVCPIVFQPA